MDSGTHTDPSMKSSVLLRLVLCTLCLGMGLYGRILGNGFQLPGQDAGTWGRSPAALVADIQNAMQNSGLGNAIAAASATANKIANSKVPAIDDLAQVVEGDVQARIHDAVSQSTEATQLLAMVDVTALKQLFQQLQSTLTPSQEFAFSIPGGRLVVRRELLNVSLCAVIAGPNGARVTLGMSDGPQLCGNPAERFANPTREPVLFADLALGYSHVQARRRLLAPRVPGPDPALSIQAATYFKIHNDWVQLRLAGNDPESLSVTLQFVVGVRMGFSAQIQAEVEGQVLLELKVLPAQTAPLLLEIGDILRSELATATPSSVRAAPALAASALRKVFAHLKAVEDRGEELGELAISFAADSGIGVGVWDTGINLASVGVQLRLTIPLEAVYSLQGDLLSAQLEAGLASSTQLVSLFEAMAEGRLTEAELQQQRGRLGATVDAFTRSVLSAYRDFLPQIRYNYEMGLYALGDIGQAADQTIPVAVVGMEVPLGKLAIDGVAAIPQLVEDVTESAKAMAWLAQWAISIGTESAESLGLGKIIPPATNGGGHVQRPRGNPPIPPTAAQWEAMAANLLDGVRFSIQLGVFRLEGASLGNLVRLTAGAHDVTKSILTGAIRSAILSNDKPLLEALRAAPAQVQGRAAELLYFNLQTLAFSFQPSIGASGTVGAELEAGVGGRLAFDARMKASLILLALGDSHYTEPDGTLLAGFDIPIELSVSGGVSVGEGVELTAEGGITVGQSLANLTLRDWGQALPVPAGLRVAGFEVIDFTGVHRQDGSIEGSGWIVLPMGGLVRADHFALDAAGQVVQGRWTGVMELGPLGTVSLADGEILGHGLVGRSQLRVGAGSLESDFILNSSGLLAGTSSGVLRVGDLEVEANLRLDSSGLLGSGKTRILGSSFQCTNLRIQPTGRITGNFAGTVAVDGQTLVFPSLEIDGDQLTGRTTLRVGSVSAAEVVAMVKANSIYAQFVSAPDVFGAGTAYAWALIDRDIVIRAEMDRAFMDRVESELRARLLAGISGIQGVLREEQEKLKDYEADVARSDELLRLLREQILQEKQKARAGAEEAQRLAEDALDLANDELDAAIDALITASGDLAKELSRANTVYRAANSVFNAAEVEVNRINDAIRALDGWYNGLDAAGRFFAWAGYQAARGGLLLTLDGARKTLAGARKTNDDAYAAVKKLEAQLQNPGPLLTAKVAKELAVADAEAKLEKAKQDLSSLLAILADPTLDPRYISVALARETILGLIHLTEQAIAQAMISIGEAGALVDHIQHWGEATLVRVEHIRLNSVVSGQGTGSALDEFELVVDALIARQPRRFSLVYNRSSGLDPESFDEAARVLSPNLYPASSWTVTPWTDDASTGFKPGSTLWAYHFNSAEPATVNGVTVNGSVGIAPRVAGRFSVEGFGAAYANDQNSLTSGGGGSALLAANFLWGANPGKITFEGLTPGQVYRATFLSVGWDNPPVTRTITFSNASGGLTFQQNVYGNDKGLRIDQTFTASEATHTITLTPANAETFHLYAMALSTPPAIPLSFTEWKQGNFGSDSIDPVRAGEDADPDGDRIPNFLEYALGLDPKAHDASSFGLPVPVTLPGGGQARQFVLPYQPTATDVVYRIRQSSDLVTWKDAFRLNLATGTISQLPGVEGVADAQAGVVVVTISDLDLFTPPSFWCLTVDKP